MIERNGKIVHALGLEELILLKWPFYSKQSTDLMWIPIKLLMIYIFSHSPVYLFFLVYFFPSFLFYFLTLQYCIGFAIYQHESATGIYVFPILNPPPSNSSVLSFQEPIIIQGQTFFSIRDDRKFVLIITLNIRKTNHMNLLIHLSVSGKADGTF